jgi:hypothetical protein
MGRTPLEDGPSADSYGTSPIEGFAFLLPASSAWELTSDVTQALGALTREAQHGGDHRELSGRLFTYVPLGTLSPGRSGAQVGIPNGIDRVWEPLLPSSAPCLRRGRPYPPRRPW